MSLDRWLALGMLVGLGVMLILTALTPDIVRERAQAICAGLWLIYVVAASVVILV